MLLPFEFRLVETPQRQKKPKLKVLLSFSNGMHISRKKRLFPGVEIPFQKQEGEDVPLFKSSSFAEFRSDSVPLKVYPFMTRYLSSIVAQKCS